MATELTLNQARELLAEWTRRSAAIAAERNPSIKAALEAGLSKTEIADILGMDRAYLYRVFPVALAGPDLEELERPGGGGSHNPAGPGQ
jgi:hypothetical protein